MKKLVLFFLFETLLAAPIKVPTEFYQNKANTRAHPGFYPFISHLDFRNMCDHIIDQSTEYFDPAEVKQGDTIYLNLWYIEWFASQVHDQIKHPYILVSGDVGDFFPNPRDQKLLYDSKCAAWFCRNMIFTNHPKLFQLPMGQDLALFSDDPNAKKDLVEKAAQKFEKKHTLYMCFYPRVFGGRAELVKLFENKPFCFSRNRSDKPFEGIDLPQFYDDVASSRFVLSPLGFETDSVRTWEAFALGSIPIVEHTFQDQIYEGLPIVIVHDWKEITEPFLEKKYEELKNIKTEKFYFDYWYRLIKKVQLQVKNNDLSFTHLENTKFSDQDLTDLKEILKDKELILYAGYFTGVRPFQLSNTGLFSRIFLFDPYLNEETFNHLNRYLKESHFLDNQDQIWSFPKGVLNDSFCNCYFFDLTHFRTALFSNSFKTEPHSLKQDILTLFLLSSPGTLICGNMAKDSYVAEVLEKLNREFPFSFQTKGNFWSITKY